MVIGLSSHIVSMYIYICISNVILIRLALSHPYPMVGKMTSILMWTCSWFTSGKALRKHWVGDLTWPMTITYQQLAVSDNGLDHQLRNFSHHGNWWKHDDKQVVPYFQTKIPKASFFRAPLQNNTCVPRRSPFRRSHVVAKWCWTYPFVTHRPRGLPCWRTW